MIMYLYVLGREIKCVCAIKTGIFYIHEGEPKKKELSSGGKVLVVQASH